MTTEGVPGLTVPAIQAVAVLDDGLRRGMYAYVRRARRPVTREEVASAVGISRKLAAFHLDKLVRAGLLRARCEAVGERRVGRTPKVYEPASTEINVTIPQRRPELVAEILLDAVLGVRDGETGEQAAVRVAHRQGADLGAAERAVHRPGRLGAERALSLAEGVLARHGFEPARDHPTSLRLRNCPFHPLAAKAPQLVCGISHAFVTGFLAGLDAPSVRATATPPEPGECCVRLCAGR